MNRKLKLDHNLTYELWNDPMFWESAPAWEDYREEAEEAVAEATEMQSSVYLKPTKIYNKWVADILVAKEKNNDRLRQIVSYVNKRRGKKEDIIVTHNSTRVLLN